MQPRIIIVLLVLTLSAFCKAIDTGTSLIYLPKYVADAFYALVSILHLSTVQQNLMLLSDPWRDIRA